MGHPGVQKRGSFRFPFAKLRVGVRMTGDGKAQDDGEAMERGQGLEAETVGALANSGSLRNFLASLPCLLSGSYSTSFS